MDFVDFKNVIKAECYTITKICRRHVTVILYYMNVIRTKQKIAYQLS